MSSCHDKTLTGNDVVVYVKMSL